MTISKKNYNFFIKEFFRIISLITYYSIVRYFPQYSPRGREFRQPRAILCKYLFRKCGKCVNIKKGAFFGSGKNIEIGDNSDIGLRAYIAGIDGGGELIIGNNVMMGPDVVILTLSHHYKDITHTINSQGYYSSKVIIEDDVWIGIRAIILPGTRIGKGSVVGAGAVVTKDIPEYTVVAGVPAKKIKRRGI